MKKIQYVKLVGLLTILLFPKIRNYHSIHD